MPSFPRSPRRFGGLARGGRRLVLALLLSTTARAETLSVVTHIHTTVSEGDYDSAEIAGMLSSQGIDAGIITDHDHLEIELGMPLARRLVRYTYRRPSIASEGVDAYVDSIRAAQRLHPPLLLVPAVEANPHYGVELDGLRLRISQLHEHILVIGLGRADIARLPSIANGFPVGAVHRLVYASSALGVLLLGAFALRWAGTRQRLRALRVTDVPVPLLALVLLAGFLAVDHLAARSRGVDPYRGDPGIAPRQAVLDWVDARGGLTFWAHPGVDERLRSGPVEVVTHPYRAALLEADRYTGFEGFDPSLSAPGALWDQLLDDYRHGRRQRPAWNLSQGDFRSGTAERLAADVNFVEVASRSEGALFDGLRRGRFYATQHGFHRSWSLEDFLVSDAGSSAGSGETLEASGRVTVTARFTKVSGSARRLRSVLVRNGSPVRFDETAESRTLTFVDEPPPPGEVTYYRLNAGFGSRVELTTNPVFVRRRASAREPRSER